MATGKNDAANECELYSVYYRRKKKEISLDTVLAGKAENSVNPLFFWFFILVGKANVKICRVAG